MKVAVRGKVRHGGNRLARHLERRSEFAPLQHLVGGGLVVVRGFNRDAKPLEDQAARIVGAAALKVEVHPLVGELADVGDVRAGDQVRLVGKKPAM